MVSLTGSVEVGREVSRLAAESIKKCVLELGGKSANVVFADCGFEAAIQGQMLAMFTTAGQVCTAGTRLIVERSVHDEFVAALAKRAGELVIGPAIDPATEMGPWSRRSSCATVERYVAKGLEEGAHLVCGGRRIDRPGYFYEPTIFTGVTPDMTIAREEIFGRCSWSCRSTPRTRRSPGQRHRLRPLGRHLDDEPDPRPAREQPSAGRRRSG